MSENPILIDSVEGKKHEVINIPCLYCDHVAENMEKLLVHIDLNHEFVMWDLWSAGNYENLFTNITKKMNGDDNG